MCLLVELHINACITYQVINIALSIASRPTVRCQVLSSSLTRWFGTWKRRKFRLQQRQHMQIQIHTCKTTTKKNYFFKVGCDYCLNQYSGSHCVSPLTWIYHTFCQISSNVSPPTLKQTIPWNSNRIKTNSSLFDLLLTSIRSSSVYLFSLLCRWGWFMDWYSRVLAWIMMNVWSVLCSESIKPDNA